ncbi:hypothetical protein PF005_g18513 [Phytophthora fragariae]|uniref:Armadillo-type fold n=1 Tax=Phytophthora fragariae TaxID=53985 RepID=A0A6A3E9E4_9STRA|nr:hypothetical protein PF009_g19477 [Phytophthora fragariae]KAE8992669.1 hypothetical protein PF011_g17463 [Phytophthora fragariae]KAE9092211.1 hypothetical protein PF007_g18599 [Phytophthora fragariae]KAE9123549.1 hypothetical protein PF006_g17399 [Phytophthora fragariae]KAE9192293.1 hypothetical protein PF005_g18513 [Phytophthora fragariae]
MDVALTVVDALRQVYTLCKTIYRQRHVNPLTYMQMMEIYVVLHSSEGVQVNDVLQRTAAVEKFSAAVNKFLKYLEKFNDMHRIVRLFKFSEMEEQRLEIVEEINQLLKMLNLASAVTVMDGAVAASRNNAWIRKKLKAMHGDIKLGHDQILKNLQAKHKLDMAQRQQLVDREHVLEGRNADADRILVHQVSILAPYEVYEQDAVEAESHSTVATVESTDTREEEVLLGDNTVTEVALSAVSDDVQEASPLGAKSEVEPSTVDVVAEILEAPLNQTGASDDEEKELSTQQLTLMQSDADEAIEELEMEPSEPVIQRSIDEVIEEEEEEEEASDRMYFPTQDTVNPLVVENEEQEGEPSDPSDQQPVEVADDDEINEEPGAMEDNADGVIEMKETEEEDELTDQRTDDLGDGTSNQLSAPMQNTTGKDAEEGEPNNDPVALMRGITDEVFEEEKAQQLTGSVDEVVDEPSWDQPDEVIEDDERDESSCQNSARSSGATDCTDVEMEDLPFEENGEVLSGNSSVPLFIQRLSSDETTAQQKEEVLLDLLRMCVTNSNRVQVYKTKGIPVLSRLVREGETFLSQLYALHGLSWFTFSFCKLRESEFESLLGCVREPTHTEMLSLLHELQSDDDEVKERAALQCSCMATGGAGDALRRVGVLPLLVGLLENGTANQKLWATEALVTLASDSNGNCVAITRAGAIPPLVGLLRFGTDMHKQEAAYALGNLAANNDENRAKIAREGAIPPMVEFVKSAADAQNQWAVYALGSLALNNEENRVLIAQEGAIRPLVKLLRVGTRAQKQWSAYTLGSLAHSDANREEITLEGAIAPLIELLRKGTAMQKQRAAFALGNLACGSNTTTDFDEAILPLVDLVRMGSDTQKEDAAYTLGNLAANNDARRAKIGRQGAIAPLVKLLKTGDGEQKQWAAFALRYLAYDNDSNRVAIVEKGAIELLTAMMEEGTDEQKEEAAHALERLVVKENDAAAISETLLGYLGGGAISQNANEAAAAALNTLGTVREGLFRRFAMPDSDAENESTTQNLGPDIRADPKEREANHVLTVAGAW